MAQVLYSLSKSAVTSNHLMYKSCGEGFHYVNDLGNTKSVTGIVSVNTIFTIGTKHGTLV